MPATASSRRSDPVIAADDQEAHQIQQVGALLAAAAPQLPRLLGPDNEAVTIPPALHQALRQIIPLLARGDAVSLVPVHQELTTQEAADLLNVSRPFVIKLLDEGALPYRRVGTHRRIRFVDVMIYKHARDRERTRLLRELVALGEEDGGYD